jgi:hypothetical protein
MIMYGKNEIVSELWAVLNDDGTIKWSRGGSSTAPHLMVYPSEKSARRALNTSWSKQIISNPNETRVELIYSAKQKESRER